MKMARIVTHHKTCACEQKDNDKAEKRIKYKNVNIKCNRLGSIKNI